MRLLILGGSGMLGHKAYQTLSATFECYATMRQSSGPWVQYPFYRDGSRLILGVDALALDTVIRAFAIARPDAVLNCIGLIKQLPEAADPLLSLGLNAVFPNQLANLCQAAGARLIHISTDCVFDGLRGAYREDDCCSADDLYGKSKDLGEVTAPGCLTLRTSLIGWDLTKKDGLLEWFCSHRGGQVKGYRNAIFSGLTTGVFAETISVLLRHHQDLSGLYHVSSGPISKYDLLTMIDRSLDLAVGIEPCDEPRINRSLDSTRFREATGLTPPTWPKMIEELAHERKLYDRWMGVP